MGGGGAEEGAKGEGVGCSCSLGEVTKRTGEEWEKILGVCF